MNEWNTLSVKEYLAVKKTKLVLLLTENYRGQASFAPDFDYLGDPHHIGCTPNKQEQEPFARQPCTISTIRKDPEDVFWGLKQCER